MLFAVFSSLVRNWRDTKGVLSFFSEEKKERVSSAVIFPLLLDLCGSSSSRILSVSGTLHM